MGSHQRSEVSAVYRVRTHRLPNVDPLPLLLGRIPNSAEWDGLEGRRKRGDQVDTFYGSQVGSVVTRRQELPDQSGSEGRDQGYVRWLFENRELHHLPFLLLPMILITGVGVVFTTRLQIHFCRITISWSRCSSNISAYRSSQRKCRSEGGTGVQPISKVLSAFANHLGSSHADSR